MIATPTITVQDNANGTGCLVQVTGSDPAALNTVQVVLTDRAGFQASAFSRTGNGSIDVGLCSQDGTTVGVNLTHAWFVQVVSTLAPDTTFSNVVAVAPTLGLDSPITEAKVAIQLALVNANLPNIGGKVYRCELPGPFMDKVNLVPCILIHPVEIEQRQASSNQSTVWTVPIMVGVADRDGTWYEKAEIHMAARWQAMQLFDRKALLFRSTPSKARRLTVQPRPIVDPEGTQFQFYYTTFVLMVEMDKIITPRS